jgi:maleylacetate reductase
MVPLPVFEQRRSQVIFNKDSFELHTQEQSVHFGNGVVERVGEIVSQLGGTKILFICTDRARESPEGMRLQKILGNRIVGNFTGIQTHVVTNTVDAAFQSFQASGADFLVSFGGGSAIGTGKAIGLWWIRQAEKKGEEVGRIPHLCIPTTYSGTEMTIIAGQRDKERRLKRPGRDQRILPTGILYDPELTLSLPSQITAGSAMNALAHCAEGLYAVVTDPLGLAAAKDAAHIIAKNLLYSVHDGNNLEARTKMLKAGFLAGFTVHHCGIGLHHGICHVLGGRYGLDHGIANSIILPYALDFNLDATIVSQAELAHSMEATKPGDSDREAALGGINFIRTLRKECGLPEHLRAVGIPEGDIPSLAEEAMHSRAVKNNPKPITKPSQIENVLRAAY